VTAEAAILLCPGHSGRFEFYRERPIVSKNDFAPFSSALDRELTLEPTMTFLHEMCAQFPSVCRSVESLQNRDYLVVRRHFNVVRHVTHPFA